MFDMLEKTMLTEIVQIQKELNTADFVVEIDGQIYGEIHVDGDFVTGRGFVVGNYNGTKFQLTPQTLGLIENGKKYKPHTINIDNKLVGGVYQTTVSTGLFSSMDYHYMNLYDKAYELYGIGLGKDGFANCLYWHDKQLAEINTDMVVYNDLHRYHIYTEKKEDVLLCILYCMYMYVLTAFLPGRKVVKSVEKHYLKSTNRKLLAKYNPDFKKKCEGVKVGKV